MNKVKNVKDQFKKELNNEKKPAPSGSAAKPKKKWEHMETYRYLQRNHNIRPQPDEHDSNSSFSRQENLQDVDSDEPDTPRTEVVQQSYLSPSHMKRKRIQNQEQRTRILSELLAGQRARSQQKCTEPDDDRLFLSSQTSRMKRLRPHFKDQLMSEIHQLFIRIQAQQDAEDARTAPWAMHDYSQGASNYVGPQMNHDNLYGAPAPAASRIQHNAPAPGASYDSYNAHSPGGSQDAYNAPSPRGSREPYDGLVPGASQEYILHELQNAPSSSSSSSSSSSARRLGLPRPKNNKKPAESQESDSE